MKDCGCAFPKVRWIKPIRDLASGKVYHGLEAEELLNRTHLDEGGVRVNELFDASS